MKTNPCAVARIKLGSLTANHASAPAEVPAAADFEAYRTDAEERLAVYRARCDALRADCDARFVGDVAQVLGRSPASVADADAALETLVREAGPERDAELVPVLHRRVLREEAILRPVMRELAGARWQRIR